MNDKIVIYHAECTDGFTAAWVAFQKYGDTATYHPMTHTDDPESLDIDNKHVILLDISYSREKILNLSKRAKTLIVLDHHVTAQKELSDLPYCIFDMTKSGAGLTWDTLFSGTKRPLLVDYVEDKDLWKFNLKDTTMITDVLESEEQEFNNWTNFSEGLEFHPKFILEKGQIIKTLKKHMIKTLCKEKFIIELAGHKIPAVNSSVWWSEIGAELCKDSTTFAAVFYKRSDGVIKVSLRSDSRVGMNVGEIAKELQNTGFAISGGGHRNSAGFTTNNSLF